jgi:hypothetical protein
VACGDDPPSGLQPVLEHYIHHQEESAMPLDDFTSPKRKWIIKSSDSETCQQTKQVTFCEEKNGEITVKCGGEKSFPPGKYDGGKNRIDLGDYEIRLKLQLVYGPTSGGPIGGSWTAEDTAGGVGGDGEKPD